MTLLQLTTAKKDGGCTPYQNALRLEFFKMFYCVYFVRFLQQLFNNFVDACNKVNLILTCYVPTSFLIDKVLECIGVQFNI